MEITGEITADEMVSHFLRAELNSDRWKYFMNEYLRKNQIGRNVIEMPNLQDEKENDIRRRLLNITRGYDNKLIFTRFPKDIVWKNVRLSVLELSKARYLKYTPWTILTKGSLSIHDAISVISEHKDIKEVQSIINYSSNIIVDDLSPKIVIVTSDPTKELIILEGCVRSTSYCIALENDHEIEAILGISIQLKEWEFY